MREPLHRPIDWLTLLRINWNTNLQTDQQGQSEPQAGTDRESTATKQLEAGKCHAEKYGLTTRRENGKPRLFRIVSMPIEGLTWRSYLLVWSTSWNADKMETYRWEHKQPYRKTYTWIHASTNEQALLDILCSLFLYLPFHFHGQVFSALFLMWPLRRQHKTNYEKKKVWVNKYQSCQVFAHGFYY